MSVEKPDVSVIIVNWNVGELLVECLSSLQAGLDGIRTEIIIVDNASVDQSVELVRTHFPHVDLIVNEKNVGFARANNVGISRARGRHIWLLNPDTVVFPDTLEQLVEFMDNTPGVGIAGCRQVYADGTWQPTCHREVTLGREAIIALGLSRVLPRWVGYGDLPLTATEPFRVDWVSGACMMVRREALERAGLLDENLFMYAEDMDLCRCVRDLGYSVYYLPNVSIIHHRGQSAPEVKSESPGTSMLLQRFMGRRYILLKEHGRLSANIYRGIVAVRMARHLLQEAVGSTSPTSRASGTSRHTSRRQEYLTVLKAALRGQM